MKKLPWDVAHVFSVPVTVADDDCDAFGHTNNVAYLKWLERVAWAHSRSLGLGLEACRRLGVACVARRHELDYLAASFAGERLQLGTWVVNNDGRLCVWRAYQIIRVADARTVLRGMTRWVCVRLANGRPRRQPREFLDAYQPVS